MRQPHAGKYAPAHHGCPINTKCAVLTSDFDAIEEAEDEAVRQIAHGHSFDATQQGRKPHGR